MPKNTNNTSPCKEARCKTPGLCEHARAIAGQAMDEARVHTTSGAVKWRGWKR